MARIYLFIFFIFFSNFSFGSDCSKSEFYTSFNDDEIVAMRAAYKEMIKIPELGSEERKNKLVVRLNKDENFFMIYFETDKCNDFSPQDIKGVLFTVSKETLEVVSVKELPYSDTPE